MKVSHKHYSYKHARGFTVLEVSAAMLLLAVIFSGIWVSIDRYLVTASDMKMHMQAFEVARNNLEEMLIEDVLDENIDFGELESNPNIVWRTAVEFFEEPTFNDEEPKGWARAKSSAEYIDTSGELKVVELECWLTQLTEEQKKKIEEFEGEYKEQELIEDIEDAALYAGASVDEILYWVDQGMELGPRGEYIIPVLNEWRRYMLSKRSSDENEYDRENEWDEEYDDDYRDADSKYDNDRFDPSMFDRR